MSMLMHSQQAATPKLGIEHPLGKENPHQDTSIPLTVSSQPILD